MKKKKSLGEKLKELRESYDMSQKQVAQALNIDRSTYSNYELDKTQPNLETLVRLARIFDVPKDALLPEDDEDTVSFRDVIKPYGMLQTLNKEERGLLAVYRSFDREQKQRLMDAIGGIINPDGEDLPEA